MGYRDSLKRAGRVAQVVGALLLGAAAGYFVASLRADAEMQKAQQSFTERNTKLESQYNAVLAREEALLARRDLHRALVSLEQRNFGTTEQLARQAGERLERQGEEYATLSQTLSSFRPTVSDDVSGQRQALLDIVRRLDEMIDGMQRP